MVVLKKINLNGRVKASTLMETLVATVLIVIVFMISSMILNNLFYNTIKNNNRAIKASLNEIEYLQKNNKLQLPYRETIGNWEVLVDRFTENNIENIELEALNSETNKTIIKQYIESKQ